jgi:hypothetical protein
MIIYQHPWCICLFVSWHLKIKMKENFAAQNVSQNICFVSSFLSSRVIWSVFSGQIWKLLLIEIISETSHCIRNSYAICSTINRRCMKKAKNAHFLATQTVQHLFSSLSGFVYRHRQNKCRFTDNKSCIYWGDVFSNQRTLNESFSK